ncbi:serine hydrolase, partial [Xanthomonas perforans]|nr:serine hydrolase [Xanthomonas perforans]
LCTGERGLPGGRVPTILHRGLALRPKPWLDIDVDGDFGSENMLAEKPDPAGKGASSGKSVASPR